MPQRYPLWFVLTGVLSLSLSGAQATTRYVSQTGGDISPYTSWADAARHVKDAISVAAAHDVILISNGVYNLSGTVKATDHFDIRSVNGPGVTELRGDDTFRLVKLTHRSTLSGLTLSHGRASGTGSSGYGGGVYANRGVISNCVIRSCSADTYGGGVYFFNNGGLLTHSRLENNESTYGGGAHCRGVGTVSNCVFIDNHAVGVAGTGGGGVYLYTGGEVVDSTFSENTVGNDGGGVLMDSGGEVRNCSFFENVAGDWGGAVAVYFTGGLARNCLMVNNRADEGGGAYFYHSGLLENCTVVGNQTLQNGSGVKFDGGGTSVNSIVYFNVGDNYNLVGSGQSFSFTCTTPALPGSVDKGGNQYADPLFLYRPDNALQLRRGSPCIGAGTNQPWMAGSKDLDGFPRLLAGRVDLGAYEFGPLWAYFSGHPLSGQPPLNVVFTNYLSGSNLTGVAFQWDAQNDGTAETNSSAAYTFSHRYTSNGYFSVRLDVTNAANEHATLVRTNYVHLFQPHLVSPNGGHISPFITWPNAATSVEAAVSVAEPGDVVLISNGQYRIQHQITITQALSVASVNGPDTTVIEGSGTSRVFRIQSDVTLSGLTISDGLATGTAENAYGGGVYLDAGGMVTNCVLAHNRAMQYGGGAYLAYGGTLTHSLIVSNRAAYGGGVACYLGGLVYDSILTTNVADTRGGGAYVSGNSILRNSIVHLNASTGDGGGVALISSGSTLQNCTVVSNQADSGGGILCVDGGNVQNTIAYFNTAASAGPNWHTTTEDYDYGAIFQNDCLTPTGGLPTVTDSFTNEPRFTISSGNPYGLSHSSPCVDQGAFSGWVYDAYDLLGTARVVGSAPDVGALERLLVTLSILSPTDGLRLPFRTTFATVSGTADGPVGLIRYSNQSPSGVVSGTIPVSSNWTFQVHLPHYGAQVISVSATDTFGNTAQDHVTIQRDRNQVFTPSSLP